MDLFSCLSSIHTLFIIICLETNLYKRNQLFPHLFTTPQIGNFHGSLLFSPNSSPSVLEPIHFNNCLFSSWAPSHVYWYLHSIKPNVWQSSLINLLFLTLDYQYSGTESVKGNPNPHVKLLLFMGGNLGGGDVEGGDHNIKCSPPPRVWGPRKRGGGACLLVIEVGDVQRYHYPVSGKFTKMF